MPKATQQRVKLEPEVLAQAIESIADLVEQEIITEIDRLQSTVQLDDITLSGILHSRRMAVRLTKMIEHAAESAAK